MTAEVADVSYFAKVITAQNMSEYGISLTHIFLYKVRINGKMRTRER